MTPQTSDDNGVLTSAEFLQRLPKVELHCHLIGSVGRETTIELARKHDIALPSGDFYDLRSLTTAEARERQFFAVLDLVARVLIDRDDFTRAALELVEQKAAPHNVRYMEVFVNPTCFENVRYTTVVDGLIEGFAAAEQAYGVRTQLIPAIYRDHSSAVATRLVETMAANRRDAVVGLAIDGPEETDRHRAAHFAEAYTLAGKAGFKRTAHATLVPPEEILACLDVLGCERIDHGYGVLESPSLMERVREQGITMTVCPTITREVFGVTDSKWLDVATHPAHLMIDAKLPVSLGTDDPFLVEADLTGEYCAMFDREPFDPEVACSVSLAGVDGSWLDEESKRSMRAAFSKEMRHLTARLGNGAARSA